MSDVLVAARRNGQPHNKQSFAIGAGPSRDLEDAVLALQELGEDDVVDGALVERVAWQR